MDVKRGLVMGFGVLALLALGLRVAEPDSAREAAPHARAGTAAGPDVPTVPSAGDGTSRPGARTRVPRVPRVVRNVGPTTVPSPGAEPAPAELATGSEGPVDRREDVTPERAASASAAFAKMKEVGPAVSACLAGWSAHRPEVERVSLAFQFDEHGLGDVWVTDREDVPASALDCFAKAIDSVDWEGVSPEPMEATFDFEP